MIINILWEKTNPCNLPSSFLSTQCFYLTGEEEGSQYQTYYRSSSYELGKPWQYAITCPMTFPAKSFTLCVKQPTPNSEKGFMYVFFFLKCASHQSFSVNTDTKQQNAKFFLMPLKQFQRTECSATACAPLKGHRSSTPPINQP